MSLKKISFITLAYIFSTSIANCDVYVDAEFLYCQASNDNLDYALHVDTSFTDGVLEGNAPMRNVEFSWDPGVRIGIGCNMDSDWNIDLIGTYIHSHAVGSDSASLTASSEFLHTLWFQSFTGFRAGSASGDWKLDFATIDLIGTRIFKPLDCFTCAPYFGLRSVLIHQRYDIDYNDVFFTLMGGGMLPFPEAEVNLSSRYLAIGLNAGIDFRISLGTNFFFNGGVAGSLVYGNSNVNERINGAFPLPGGILIPTHLSLPQDENHLRANLESETSFSYKTCWKDHVIEFSVGYFFSIWFNQNDFFNLVFTSTNIVDIDLADNLTTIDSKEGNLQIQGLILGATLYF